MQNQPMTMVGESEELTDGLRTQVLFAREYLKDVNIGEKQVERLVQEAARGGCQGHRAELFAARVAKACAALDVRTFSFTYSMYDPLVNKHAIIDRQTDEVLKAVSGG
jgi:Mg-chelatase subunit ChlI